MVEASSIREVPPRFDVSDRCALEIGTATWPSRAAAASTLKNSPFAAGRSEESFSQRAKSIQFLLIEVDRRCLAAIMHCAKGHRQRPASGHELHA